MESWIASNLIWVMTCVFGAGGLWVLVRTLSKRLDEHEGKIEAKFDALTKRDLEHDKRLGELENRAAVLAERVENVTGWLREMRNKIDGIYEKLLGGK